MSDQSQMMKALREARLAEASQLDSILALQDARALRLDALRAELVPQLANNAAARAMFDLNVQTGATPRLWIDLVSFVVMEPDSRTYRLVQDHEDRRSTLFETRDLQHMVQFATKYLAHRIIAREKAALGITAMPMGSGKVHTRMDLVYVWVTGCVFGVLAMLVCAMLLGRTSL